MSNSLGITVTGFAELKRKIELLASDKDKKKEMLLILRQVAKPTLNAARVLAPVASRKHKARGVLINPGNLKKSLGNITGKSANPTIYVGARVKGVNKGWYAHFVHDGINVYSKGFKRKHKKGANSHAAIRRTTANPFLTKAYESTKNTVTTDAERKMALFIQRRIDKLS
jgi:HK97 gp10 family phage protein